MHDTLVQLPKKYPMENTYVSSMIGTIWAESETDLRALELVSSQLAQVPSDWISDTNGGSRSPQIRVHFCHWRETARGWIFDHHAM